MRIAKIIGILLIATTAQVLSQKSPLYYGWFFNETIATGLRNITSDYLTKLYGNVDKVQEFLRNASTATGIENPLQYYTKPVDSNTGNWDPFYHITTFYCGTADCSDYSMKVAEYLNQSFATHLVGVFFTPRTYGIRVNLTSIQRAIFDLNESNDIGSRPIVNGSDVPCDTELWNGIQFCPQDEKNIHPTDTRAHVTLGCAPNVSAVTTGLDLIEILDLELDPSRFCAEIQTEQGNLIQMGEKCDHFVVYLKKKMVANSTFEAYLKNDAVILAPLPCRMQFLSLVLFLVVFANTLSVYFLIEVDDKAFGFQSKEKLKFIGIHWNECFRVFDE